MTNRSLPQPAELVEAVEAYISALPEKRRRKRTREEINAGYDTSPELENYAPVSVAQENDSAALAEFKTLLRQLGETHSAYVAHLVTLKIYKLLDLEPE